MTPRRKRRPGRRPKGEAPGPERVPQIPRSPVPALPVRVEGRRVIRAAPQKVFQLVSRVEAQPRVTGLWLAVDVLDRGPGQLTVQYRGYFAGVPLESVQRITLAAPNRVEFRQTRGGLRALEGRFLLQAVDGDTELTMLLDADIGMPLISEAAAARVLRAHVERTLEKVKLVAERELPRVVRRPRESPAVTGEGEPAASPETEPEEEMEEPVASETPEPPAAVASTAEAEPTAPAGPRRRRRRRRRRKPPAQTGTS